MCIQSELARDNQLIDALGGTSEVAKLCGGITPQAVSQWRSKGVPKSWRLFIQIKRPDVYAGIVAPNSQEM
jgi:hypothetical protein